ncbi:class I SAM-dependent methyltransferase [Paraburkholderia susongensis]|uniref:Predicted O-methyltransferase YrrM n=1 Tax=Paraburkholderia susongensis TaxID=1515439 RepID=A0A1X7M1B1_9BURK|nr:class I SAM-dependent methyltransferase [Paraburkholderia susongensis]SMG59948.1 Predicted O-methyltransferase YrrM [Paraburkholderia susongensis]
MVSVAGAVSARVSEFQAALHCKTLSLYHRSLAEDLSFTEAVKKYPDRNALYAYMHHYYKYMAPKELREHRHYFTSEQRGFGEDAFHAMWWLLLREYRPRNCLEIGVYRGQVTSLIGLIAKLCGFECEIHGISPFSPVGDTVSTYLTNIDYLEDTLASNRRFGLPDPQLLKAYSTDPVAIQHIQSRAWDLIYIDGNHDYEVVLADYALCRDSLAPGGLLVMDDSSLYTDYNPVKFSFGGHPGPSRVVKELAFSELRFLGGVGHNNVFSKS